MITARENNPIPPKIKKGICAHFTQSYKNGLNPTLTDEKLDVKWVDVKPFLNFENLINQTTLGVALFYVLDNPAAHFTYIITVAQRINVGGSNWEIHPIPQVSQGYFMFDNSMPGGHKIVPHSMLPGLLENYKNLVKLRIWPDGSINNALEVKNLPNGHPKVCFFEGNKFYHWITQNITTLTSLDFDLTVHNGALFFDDVIDKNNVLHKAELQTPILVIEKNNAELISNNFDIAFPYKSQALDVGRLCPPECD